MFSRILSTLACFLLALLVPICEAVTFEGVRNWNLHTNRNDTDNTHGGCAEACAVLQSTFGQEQVITNSSNSLAYSNYTDAYWSVFQEDVTPSCVFKPKCAEELGAQIRVSKDYRCPFAAKSGGHGCFVGASSSPGIAISLEHFNQIEVDHAVGTANIGPGNRWVDVYAALQAHDLVVIGGRVASIGVGGLTTGGGISHLSNLHGWACDNVKSYQLVTADGTVKKVTADENKDLFWALRGGGPNFGIVTNFELKTYPLPGGLIWSGAVTYLDNDFAALNKAFVNLGTTGLDQDGKAAQILSYVAYQGAKLASVYLSYAEPTANASVFDEYLAIPDPISGYGTQYVRTLANATLEMDESQPVGLRQSYWTATYALTLDMTTYLQEKFFDAVQPINDVANIVPAMSLQTITKSQVKYMSANGGNPLGLSEDKAPYLLLDLSAEWTDPAADERVLTAYHDLLEEAKAYAQASGQWDSYVYMNYGSQFQDVISGYGAENKAKLQRISKKHDPDQVFQELGPGYFRLAGPPAQWSATSS